jgi:hypothetical protein
LGNGGQVQNLRVWLWAGTRIGGFQVVEDVDVAVDVV